MAKKFQNLRDKMTPTQRAKASAMAKILLDEMPMHELRHARQLTQEQLAAVLEVKQGSVSKLERRTDLYISTLRRYIEAMGGNLELRANFPEGSVSISSLGQIEEIPDEAVQKP
ncbi:unnamed protein product, partial [marine sediment metagenome]